MMSHQRRLELPSRYILVSVAVNLFSEFIEDDRTPTTIASYRSFCIIYNRVINPNNFKTALFLIVFHS